MEEVTQLRYVEFVFQHERRSVLLGSLQANGKAGKDPSERYPYMYDHKTRDLYK